MVNYRYAIRASKRDTIFNRFFFQRSDHSRKVLPFQISHHPLASRYHGPCLESAMNRDRKSRVRRKNALKRAAKGVDKKDARRRACMDGSGCVCVYIYICVYLRVIVTGHRPPVLILQQEEREGGGGAQSEGEEEEEGSGHLSLSDRLTTVSLPTRLPRSASDSRLAAVFFFFFQKSPPFARLRSFTSTGIEGGFLKMSIL